MRITSKLEVEIPGPDGNSRTYLTLPDGRKLPLPYHWREEEFALEGNLELHDMGRYVAVYDESTRTGAFFTTATTNYWTLLQPCTREYWFDELVPWYVERAKYLDANPHV